MGGCVCVCVGGRSPEARGRITFAFCTPPRRDRAPSPLQEGPHRAGPRGPNTAANPTRPSHARSLEHGDRAGPDIRWGGKSRRGGSGPPSPSPSPSSRGRAEGGCRPSWAPSCSGGGCFCSGAAAAAAGARCRSRRRGCGSAGDSTVWEPSAGPVCAIELLIHRKKGGREKKEVTCPGYTYAKRSSRRREKLRRAGGGGREAAAEAAAAREAAAAARPGTDTHLYECACGS